MSYGDKHMRTFEVRLTRDHSDVAILEVEARSHEEAEQIAMRAVRRTDWHSMPAEIRAEAFD